MRFAQVLIGLALIAAPVAVRAHAPDEYVQALQLDVAPASITVHVRLTPGEEIAGGLTSRLDRDGNGRIDPAEAEAYGRAVLGDVTVSIDGLARTITLGRVEVPTVNELASGGGSILVDASLDAPDSPGRHRLIVRNTHAPVSSVYLANAMQPRTRSIAIGRQHRDQRQQVLQLDYDVESTRFAAGAWGLGGLLLLLAHASWRIRSKSAPAGA